MFFILLKNLPIVDIFFSSLTGTKTSVNGVVGVSVINSTFEVSAFGEGNQISF